MTSTPPAVGFQAYGFKPPTLLISPDEDYAAIFEHGDNVAVLRSQAGRCVLAYPVRSQVTPNPVLTTQQYFESLGYVRQDLPSDNFVDFVQQFMTTAGFTLGHVNQTFKLGSP